MNDLIKEFARQAGFKVNWQHEDVQAIKMAQYKEFAELIVRECVTTMTNLESDIKQQFPWKKEEVVSTSGHIQKLKEHFGVEE